MNLLTDEDIESSLAQVEAVNEGKVGPDRANYLALSAEDFELLLYSIYKGDSLRPNWYDHVRLMLTGADQGRDVWLTKDERPVGLIQCKRVKSGFTLPDTVREVIKFLLNAILEPELMPDATNFCFTLALPSEPAGTTTTFFEAPQTWLHANEAQLPRLVTDVIQRYEGFSKLKVEIVTPIISAALRKLRYKLLRPVDLDELLERMPAVRQRFFKVQLVVSVADAEAMLDARLAAVGLVPKRVMAYTKADIQEDIARGSHNLASWPQAIWGQHLEREELGELINRIHTQPEGATLVIGGAGTGKSALLAELYRALEARDLAVLAIKADMLSPDVWDFTSLSHDIGMSGDIEQELLALAIETPVVLIIDQLDAVSEVMDQSSQRMQVLLRLASRLQAGKDHEGKKLPIHVVVSSRPFEAKFDARFRQLDAEELPLSLPPFERVASLLDNLGIDAATVPDSLKEALRTPFALGIYVDLAKIGMNATELTSANMLDRWLDKKLPTGAARASCMTFLRQLAVDMTQHESLWRPTAHYEPDHSEMLRLFESVGILIREEANIGFSHQSWLDDFQAKAFQSAESLASFAWNRQEGLFARGTILRGLEYMRRIDVTAYEMTVRLLLLDPRTRRHLRHLVADFLASADDPSTTDIAWIEWMARNDQSLANRAFRQVASKWVSWRSGLLPLLPYLMQDGRHRWNARMLLVHEVAQNPDRVMDLVDRYWAESSYDGDVFTLCERSGMATDRAIAHVRTIFGRTKLAHWAISHYAKTLHEGGNTHVALDLISMWAETQVEDRYNSIKVHGLEKIAAASPLYCAEKLFPWFIAVISGELGEGRAGHWYPKSASVSLDWKHEPGQGHLAQVLRSALELSAVSDSNGTLALLATVSTVEIDEVQSLIADTLATNPEVFAAAALTFLLVDPRRLYLGSETFDDERGVSHLICGWSSSNLLAQIATHLGSNDIDRIRDYIEAWEPWGEKQQEESDPALRKKFLRWSEGRRLRLLAELPAQSLSARRRRQAEEWKAAQPKLQIKRGIRLVRAVVPPMNHMQMSKANDSAIIKMLTQVNDHMEHRRSPSNRLRGGVIELSRAFAEFAKTCPDRALYIISKLHPSLHKQTVGAAINELSSIETVNAASLKGLIWDLHARGFSSRGFYHDAANAMAKLAERLKGLEERDIKLMRGWLQRDADVLANEAARHAELNKSNRARNEKPDQRPEGILFGRLGGMHIVPQRNFTILSAIAAGYLCRDGVDCNGWLAELEAHVTQPEDPEIWRAILMFRSHELLWADEARVGKLGEEIWKKFPATFEECAVAHSLWRLRPYLSPQLKQEIVNFWLSQDDHRLRQVGGEFAAACAIVDDAAACAMKDTVDAVMAKEDVYAKTGVIFSMAAGWAEQDLDIRRRSHTYLIGLADSVSGFEAHALSKAVGQDERLHADDMTRAMLTSVAANSELLREAIGLFFLQSLQHLLLYPGFEMLVLELSEAAVELALASSERTVDGFDHGELIGLVIALQRSTADIKARAMTTYEKLLDAEIYGAEEAAASALRR